MPSQFNNLIQSKSIASITPQQILAAGQPVFFDILTSPDITAINKLIQGYSRIHAPTYGQPIPLSGSISSTVGAGEVLEPTANEIRKIFAGSVTNAGGGAPVVGSLALGGMEIASFVANPSSTSSISLQAGLFASFNLPVTVSVSSGDASDLTTSIASLLVVQ